MGYQPLAAQLPAELLEEICCINVDCELDKQIGCCRRDHRTYHDILPAPLQDIVNASQVCKAWRYALIQCPSLWQHFIDPSHPRAEWRQLMLERSKPLGITYSLLSPGWVDEKEFEMEMCYADLLTSYSVALRMNCDIWKREHLVPKRWPKLEYLCIAHLFYEPDTHEQVENFQVQMLLGHMQMPDDFPSAESTPLLKRLHLHSCFLKSPPQLLGLTSLTELRVSRALDISRNPIWSPSRWLEVIVALRHLRRLSLIHSIARYERSGVDHGDKVYPLHLEEFYLEDCERTVSYFFRHLDIKITRIFHLFVYPSTNSIDSVEEMKLMLTHISPIIQYPLTVNQLFRQNSILSIKQKFVGCYGFHELLPGGMIPRSPRDIQPEGTIFEGPHVEIVFGYPAFLNAPIPDFFSVLQSKRIIPMFRPMFHQVTSLVLDHCADQLIYDNVDLLSEILWKSSHRLLGLSGVDLQTWPVIHQNMLLSNDSESTPPTYNVHIPFLRVLTDLNFSIDQSIPSNHPLVIQLVEFRNYVLSRNSFSESQWP